MSKQDDIRTIERDLEETRARTESTINALQNRLQPRAVLDEATRFFQGTDSGEYAEKVTRNAIAQARENPLPLALMGIGAALLATKRPGRPVYMNDPAVARDDSTFYDAGAYTEGTTGVNATQADFQADYAEQETELTALYDAEWEDTHRVIGSHEAIDRTYTRLDGEDDEAFQSRLYTARGTAFGIDREKNEDETSFRKRIDERVEAAKTKSAEYKNKAAAFKQRQTERASALASRAGDAASRVHGKVQDGAAHAADRTRETYRGARDGAVSLAGDARQGAGSLASDSRDAARRGAQKTGQFYEQNPLVGAALAVAAGAVTAAFFGTTQQERRALGGVADDINDGAKRLNERANEKVAEYAKRVQSVAEDAGDRVEDVADDLGGTTTPGQRKGQTGATKTS